MKILGFVMTVIGLIWALFAYNMDVSVTTKSETIGSGAYSITVPSVTVNNIGLMDQRRNHLMGAGVLFIAGILLGVLGGGSTSRAESSGGRRPCPFCAELISVDAVICRFCQKDVPMPVIDDKKPVVHQPVVSSGAKSITYCQKCTAMNDGEAVKCFRCDEPLTGA